MGNYPSNQNKEGKMMITTNTASKQFQGPQNIMQGSKGTEGAYLALKGGLSWDVKREDAHTMKNLRGINKSINILCRHVLTGRVKAHKICCKNHECYHCAYDQMIDDQDMDVLNEKLVC
jgi:hypothetical protein